MRYLAVALIVVACLAGIVLLVVFAKFSIDDLICPVIILGGVTVAACALMMGRSLDDL